MADRDMEIERNMLRSTLAEVLARAEAAEARLAALRQAMEALADEWEPGVWAISNGCAARSLRAVLAEHATPSDDTAAMSIDPSPPGVTPLPPEQARPILDALDATPSDPPQDEPAGAGRPTSASGTATAGPCACRGCLKAIARCTCG